jgi:hypothetical protein
VNPLQQMQTIIAGLLFQIGDEQIAMPDQVVLVMVSGGKAIQFSVQHGNGASLCVIVPSNIDIDEDAD